MFKKLEHELRKREIDKALKGQEARVKINERGKECEKERETT